MTKPPTPEGAEGFTMPTTGDADHEETDQRSVADRTVSWPAVAAQ